MSCQKSDKIFITTTYLTQMSLKPNCGMETVNKALCFSFFFSCEYLKRKKKALFCPVLFPWDYRNVFTTFLRVGKINEYL